MPESPSSAPPVPETVLLWPHGAPNAAGDTPEDHPNLTVYLPPSARANGGAVVLCPGGGYGFLAVDHEGVQVAQWFNARGIATFLLRYRIGPRYRHPAPLQDAHRAMRIVRSRAAEWNVKPDRIGLMGFSAGGHLASSAATHLNFHDPNPEARLEGVSPRPDFLILGYPVITFTEPYMHQGSRDMLLGPNFAPELAAEFSNERKVTPQTPPTFLFHTDADDGVPPQNSVAFYLALHKAKVPAEMHIYEQGPHGVGLAPDDPILSSWPGRLEDWLRVRGILPKRGGARRVSAP